MDQTTARLRKTFHYPDENDSDDSLPEVLDEQEQSRLISTLSTTNAEQNLRFSRLLLAVPLLCVLPYIPTLFARIRPSSLSAGSANRASLLSLLSITSLVSSAWLLWALPPEKTGIVVLDNLHERSRPRRSKPSNSAGARRYQEPEFDAHNFIQSQPSDSGPLLRYLPLLNLGLCLVLVLLGLVYDKSLGRFDSGDDLDIALWTGFGWLPGFVYVVIVVAKWIMGGVNPEDELTGLRYPFKGA